MADGALNPGCPSGLAVAADAVAPQADASAFVRHHGEEDTLELMIKGASCAGCIRKIEGGLLALPGVTEARLNLSTQRLRVSWRAGALEARRVTETLTRLGYGAAAFDPEAAQRQIDQEGRRLLRYLAVAGFAAMNIMMFSAPIWFGDDMGAGTRTALHWVSALIAIPAALYAAQPFFRSAYTALKARRANMDVPISLAVLLTLGMSIAETLQEGAHTYFDGITMLLFFLLIGRYLDHQLREKARTAAKDLLAMQSVSGSRIERDGTLTAVSARDIAIGDRLMLAAGDRVLVDGVIEEGASDIDRAMLTGETTPSPARVGDAIQAGAVNLTGKLVMRASARAEDSAVAELARLIEVGEQGRAGFVRIADRAAALYVPVVHSMALLTFCGWLLAPVVAHALGFAFASVGIHGALQNAVAVLIITCPCALGLAVPAVQVVATGRLFTHGVLVKSGDALERLAQVNVVVFDKTGTLTRGKPRLVNAVAPDVLTAAASLARVSRHPLSRAIVEAAGPGVVAPGAVETAGAGIEASIDGRRVKLGRRTFAAPDMPDSDDGAAELWFADGSSAPVRFVFEDAVKTDAAATIAALRARGLEAHLISGDRPAAVEACARAVGIESWQAQVLPSEKIAYIRALRLRGLRPLMVGDGLNDAAALAAAHASASPGTAVQASQAAADIVFQGELLAPVVEAIDVARRARARALENLRFSAAYNLIAAPAAAFGLLTPLIAALAMSGSSLAVTLNALRMQLERR